MQTVYGLYPVLCHVESQIGFAISGQAVILWENQNVTEGSSKATVPTIDKRRVIPIDAGCEQGDKKIHVQAQNTFKYFQN